MMKLVTVLCISFVIPQAIFSTAGNNSPDAGYKRLTDFLRGKDRLQNNQIKVGSNFDYDKKSNSYSKNDINMDINEENNSEYIPAHSRIKRQYGYYGARNRYAGGRGGGRFGLPGGDWRGGGGGSMLSNPCAYGAGQQGGCMRKKRSASEEPENKENNHIRIKRQYGYYGARNRYAGESRGGGRFGRPGGDWGGGRSMLSNPCAYGAGQQGGCMRKKRSASEEPQNKENRYKRLTDLLHGKTSPQNRQIKIESISHYDKNSSNSSNKNGTNVDINKINISKYEPVHSRMKRQYGYYGARSRYGYYGARNRYGYYGARNRYGYYGARNRYAGGRRRGGRFGRPGGDWGGGGRSMLSNPCAYGAGQQAGCMRKKRSVNEETENEENNKNEIICPANTPYNWSVDFMDCFSRNQFTSASSSIDVHTIVDRILQYSMGCIQNYTKPCRPDYQGFVIIMSKIISQMQKYTRLYLKNTKYKPEEIKNLKCLHSLSTGIYKKCFETAFAEKSSDEDFQKNVEKSITCTNKYHKFCSNSTQSTINKIVRTILGVQKANKISKDKAEPEVTENTKKMANYKTMFLFTLWDMSKSFFGS